MNSFTRNPFIELYALKNFLSAYSLSESSKMLNDVFDQVTEGTHFAIQDSNDKEKMLDFLEALEELLPELYKLQEERVEELRRTNLN